jgi:hypothetical protein
MRANVKPLTHWLIYHGYTVRFRQREPRSVQGVITAPDGAFDFEYDPESLTIRLTDAVVTINEHGWETGRELSANQHGKPNERDHNRPE